MNLHAIASGVVAAVNPPIDAIVRISCGYDTASDGKRTPKYLPPVTVPAQLQSMTFGDLRQVEGLNLQGDKRGIYLYGNLNGIVRAENKGGDMITLAWPGNALDGSEWLVAMVLEHWPDWCKVAVTLQKAAYRAPNAGLPL
jgi:hypothetical protein